MTNVVQRILGKIVGHEISAEELKLISGGAVVCKKGEIQTVYSDNTPEACDKV